MSRVAPRIPLEGTLAWIVVAALTVGALAVNFLSGTARRAEDAEARSNIWATFVAAKELRGDDPDYLQVTPQGLGDLAPSLAFTVGPSLGPADISLAGDTTGTQFVMKARSASGACYWLVDLGPSGLSFGKSFPPEPCTAATEFPD